MISNITQRKRGVTEKSVSMCIKKEIPSISQPHVCIRLSIHPWPVLAGPRKPPLAAGESQREGRRGQLLATQKVRVRRCCNCHKLRRRLADSPVDGSMLNILGILNQFSWLVVRGLLYLWQRDWVCSGKDFCIPHHKYPL